jgi:hypothetical protein
MADSGIVWIDTIFDWAVIALVELAKLFNGLLWSLSHALRNIENVKLENSPRMADFAKIATAAEFGFGFKTGSVVEAINRRQQDHPSKGDICWPIPKPTVFPISFEPTLNC